MATIQNLLRQLLCPFIMLCIGVTRTTVAHSQNAHNIIKIALSQLHVREATGNNDGPEVKQYLNYVGMEEGQEWCAAFVCWSYAQAGYTQPRNAWSPALFPRSRTLNVAYASAADIFGIWVAEKNRLGHVGLLYQLHKSYWICIEGNSNNGVRLKRRPAKTFYKIATWAY